MPASPRVAVPAAHTAVMLPTEVATWLRELMHSYAQAEPGSPPAIKLSTGDYKAIAAVIYAISTGRQA